MMPIVLTGSVLLLHSSPPFVRHFVIIDRKTDRWLNYKILGL